MDVQRLQTFVDQIDISAAVEKLQNNVGARIEELSNERRALEYRMKESFATLERSLSTKLSDTSLDPLREGVKAAVSVIQELEKRLKSAETAVASIDVKGACDLLEAKIETVETQLQGVSSHLERFREEETMKNYSELVSARPLHQQGCLSCGVRTATGKVAGLLGSDRRLYKGDSRHNNIAAVARQRQHSASSEMPLEQAGHKSNLSLPTEVTKLTKVGETPRRRGLFCLIPQTTPTNAAGPFRVLTATTPHERDHSEEDRISLRLRR